MFSYLVSLYISDYPSFCLAGCLSIDRFTSLISCLCFFSWEWTTDKEKQNAGRMSNLSEEPESLLISTAKQSSPIICNMKNTKRTLLMTEAKTNNWILVRGRARIISLCYVPTLLSQVYDSKNKEGTSMENAIYVCGECHRSGLTTFSTAWSRSQQLEGRRSLINVSTSQQLDQGLRNLSKRSDARSISKQSDQGQTDGLSLI